MVAIVIQLDLHLSLVAFLASLSDRCFVQRAQIGVVLAEEKVPDLRVEAFDLARHHKGGLIHSRFLVANCC